MADVKEQAWGLIEWGFTGGAAVITFIVGYLTLFLAKKWNKDIDSKIEAYCKIETDKRMLRQATYEVEFNHLNEKFEGMIDKLEAVETELRERDGILDRIKDNENDIKNLKGE